MTRPRRARGPRPVASLIDVGEPPDPRFTLANERTFLAWIRTTLALLATGLAAVELLASQPRAARVAIGVPLMLLGAAVSARSYARWEAVERALRLRQPLPYLPLPRLIGIGVATLAVLASILVLLRL